MDAARKASLRQASVMFSLEGERWYPWNTSPVTDWFTTHIEFSRRIRELLAAETGEQFSVGEMGYHGEQWTEPGGTMFYQARPTTLGQGRWKIADKWLISTDNGTVRYNLRLLKKFEVNEEKRLITLFIGDETLPIQMREDLEPMFFRQIVKKLTKL